MFTLTVGDICERFYDIIPVVVLVMHYGPVTLLKFPDSVSIVLQPSRSFLSCVYTDVTVLMELLCCDNSVLPVLRR